MSRGRDIDDREIAQVQREPAGQKQSQAGLRSPREALDLNAISQARGQDHAQPDGTVQADDARERDDHLNHDPSDQRRRVLTRDKPYSVSNHDLETMEEIGMFRAVDVEDLKLFHFRGNGTRMQNRLRSLTAQGLIQRRTIMMSKGEKLRILVLSNAGRRLVEQERGWDGHRSQHVYAGLKKIAEISHDAAIDGMYQAEAENIRCGGGIIRRVVLDYELKKMVFSPLAKTRQASPELYQQRQDEIARANGLAVVDGKIPLPDLRIEYETRDGTLEKVDLELTTDNYRGSQMAQKSRAGFKLYFSGSSHSRGGSAWDDRELTRGILSV